jgi:hypothetical protein
MSSRILPEPPEFRRRVTLLGYSFRATVVNLLLEEQPVTSRPAVVLVGALGSRRLLASKSFRRVCEVLEQCRPQILETIRGGGPGLRNPKEGA